MVASTRPEWTNSSCGVQIDTVVRLHGGAPGARQDILTSRNRVSLIRPGSLQPKPEDEYELSYTYGPEATTADIHDRSIVPLLRKFVEGYNVSIMLFGATGSGKTTTLEGGRGKDTRNSSEGDGLVHLSIDSLYELVHAKAVAVGDVVAKKRRMPSAKGFDFFIESSFTELYSENCHDLYAKGAQIGSNLPVVEDVNEGHIITGLSTRAAKNSTELRLAFNMGRGNRDKQMMDLGSVHERTTAIFTIWLAQYAPAAVHGEEDRIIVSKLLFVDMPGSERLGMDPEVLRLREGVQLNKSLLNMAITLRRLAQEGSAEYINYDDAVLTKLLSDTLGGNCLTLMIGTIKKGEWDQSSTTLRHLTMARGARNFPIINHSRARGLLHKLRFRLLSVMEDRETLREQLSAAPADGDPNDIAINIAKVRDLEARLLEEREEKASLLSEKQALAARLAKLKDAGTDELREKAELQDALIRSEEQRLEISRALIDFQMEVNEAKQEYEAQRFALEQRILELEGSRLEQFVKREEHAALADERDRLNSALKDCQEDLARTKKAVLAAEEQAAEHAKEVKRLNQLLQALEMASTGDATALLADQEDGEAMQGALAASSLANKGRQGAQAGSKVSLAEIKQQLQRQLKQQERRIAELEQQLSESQQQLEATRALRAVSQDALNQARTLFARRMEAAAREVAELTRQVAVAGTEPGSMLRLGPDELLARLQRYVDDLLQVADAHVAELRHDGEDLEKRHVDLKRRFRLLYNGYRALRYKLEDEWPAGAGQPPSVVKEEVVVTGSLEEILRSEDDADRKALARAKEQLARLETSLGALKVRQMEYDALGAAGLGKLSGYATGEAGSHASDVAGSSALRLENNQLRAELERLKRRLHRTTSEATGNQTALVPGGNNPVLEQLTSELAQARAENSRLRVELLAGARGGLAVTAGTAAGAGSKGDGDASTLRKQLKEFTINTQLELERKLQSAETRALMAEEQLSHLNKYMAQASVAYQREIVKLRNLVKQLDPTGSAATQTAAPLASRPGPG